MKKTYEIPSITMALLAPCTIICVSPGRLNNSGQGTNGLGGGVVIGG